MRGLVGFLALILVSTVTVSSARLPLKQEPPSEELAGLLVRGASQLPIDAAVGHAVLQHDSQIHLGEESTEWTERDECLHRSIEPDHVSGEPAPRWSAQSENPCQDVQDTAIAIDPIIRKRQSPMPKIARRSPSRYNRPVGGHNDPLGYARSLQLDRPALEYWFRRFPDIKPAMGASVDECIKNHVHLVLRVKSMNKKTSKAIASICKDHFQQQDARKEQAEPVSQQKPSSEDQLTMPPRLILQQEPVKKPDAVPQQQQVKKPDAVPQQQQTKQPEAVRQQQQIGQQEPAKQPETLTRQEPVQDQRSIKQPQSSTPQGNVGSQEPARQPHSIKNQQSISQQNLAGEQGRDGQQQSVRRPDPTKPDQPASQQKLVDGQERGRPGGEQQWTRQQSPVERPRQPEKLLAEDTKGIQHSRGSLVRVFNLKEFFRINPHKRPSDGTNVQECVENYKALFEEIGIWREIDRRTIEAMCDDIHKTEWTQRVNVRRRYKNIGRYQLKLKSKLQRGPESLPTGESVTRSRPVVDIHPLPPGDSARPVQSPQSVPPTTPQQPGQATGSGGSPLPRRNAPSNGLGVPGEQLIKRVDRAYKGLISARRELDDAEEAAAREIQDAQTQAQRAVEDAQKTAQRVVNDAQKRAQRLVEDAEQHVQEAQEDLEDAIADLQQAGRIEITGGRKAYPPSPEDGQQQQQQPYQARTDGPSKSNIFSSVTQGWKDLSEQASSIMKQAGDSMKGYFTGGRNSGRPGKVLKGPVLGH